MESSDLMVIGPHPDDSEFGVAGLAAKLTREGKRVVYIICTNGDKGSDDPDMTPEKLARIREVEQRAACATVGVDEVVFLGYPDQGLEDTSEFRKAVVRVIRRYRPEMVATCDPYRRYLWHRDHRVCGQVVLDAVYPYARDRMAYPDLIAEGLLPHKVRVVLLWGSEDPNHYVDISETFGLKVAALRCHESQSFVKHWPDMEARMRERYAAIAKGRGFGMAEAFRRIEAPG